MNRFSFEAVVKKSLVKETCRLWIGIHFTNRKLICWNDSAPLTELALCFILKETYYAFFGLFFPPCPSVCFIAWAWKRSLKLKSPSQQSSSFPRETLLLIRLIGCPAFNSMTLWHHSTSSLPTFAQFMPIFSLEVKLTGSWKHNRADRRQGEQCWLRCVRMDQSEEAGYLEGGP